MGNQTQCRAGILVMLAAAVGMAVPAIGQTPNSVFLGTRWARPGPDSAVKIPPYGNGEATWSIVAANIGLQPGAPDAHPGMTFDFDGLLPPMNINRPADLFAAAVNTWETAANMTFKNLGMVVDGGGTVGGPNNASNVGDIRAAVFRFPTPPPVESQPDADVLAHAFQPDTATRQLVFGAFGSIGGDVHFRPSVLQDINNGVDWVDSVNAPFGTFDLLTVMIHEVGHALGLGHNTGDPNSVMQPMYMGSRRTLSASDIMNIRTLYAPEPLTAAMLAAGMLMACRRRPRQAARG